MFGDEFATMQAPHSSQAFQEHVLKVNFWQPVVIDVKCQFERSLLLWHPQDFVYNLYQGKSTLVCPGFGFELMMAGIPYLANIHHTVQLTDNEVLIQGYLAGKSFLYDYISEI